MNFKTFLLFPLLCFAAFAQEESSSPILSELKDKLVRIEDKNLKKVDDSTLSNIQYFVFYYSAHWCPPCRAFTPKFVEFYNKQKPLHPQFEVVFISSDRDQSAMKSYMTEARMPWPAVQFSQIERLKKIQSYAGSGIPCVVVVDSSGKVVADSFKGGQYLGPQKPLDDLLKLLK